MAPASHRPHILLIPLPVQGHINPMLHFASHLASRGCHVTFLLTLQGRTCTLKASRRRTPLDPHIRFVAMPDQLPPSFQVENTLESGVQLMDEMQKQQGVLAEVIDSSRTDSNPISCVIFDFFNPWALDVARKAGLPGVLYVTTTATFLHVGHLANSGQLIREDLERDHLDLGSLRIESPQILSDFFSPTVDGVSRSVREAVEKASRILINSFEALEGFLEWTGPIGSKMRYIGPCLPVDILESGPGNDGAGVQESLPSEEVELRTWLDSQAACSVLFISFGSAAHVPADQMEQIALGIEESKQKFLWVVRPDSTGKSWIPEGFVERTKEQGRVIPWAQQLQVLEHPATGGFMTHCGWNSTLESIFMGVPMLCVPLSADQPLNGYLIVKQWRVGMALGRDSKVRKEEVARGARCLMKGYEGRELRERAARLKEWSRLALREGKGVETFVEEVTKGLLSI